MLSQLATALTLASLALCAVPPVVNTTTGPVQGFSDAKALKWFGIPFAAPPVRFGAPRDAKPWTTPLNTTAYKPTCIQYSNTTVSSGGPESEDCLYVNIWVPNKKRPAGGWPVMFWIYGGDLTSGSGSVPGYDGTNLASARGVIVINHNYRLGAFGFPNSPELPVNEGNPGFLDQRKALAWTAANIARFGGNPNKITIFGESAGAYSVKMLVAKPPRPLQFRAAIMESEAASEKNGPAGWAGLTKGLGCSNSTSQLACVRSKSVAQIKSVITEQRLGFSPVQDSTFSSDVTNDMRGNSSAKVPIIIGTNANEGTYFTNRNQDPAQFQYAANYVTLYAFQCPVSQLAPLMASSGFPSVNRYYFNTSFADTAPFPGAGVYHSIEIAPIYGNYYNEAEGKAFAHVSNAIQLAWTRFAKDPKAGPGWNKTTATAQPVYVFNPQSQGIISAAKLDAQCAPLQPLVTAAGLKV